MIYPVSKDGPGAEGSWCEYGQQVRAWLLAAAHRAAPHGLPAGRMASIWAQDYPDTQPLSASLSQIGFKKMINFLFACSDLVRVQRVTDEVGMSPTEVLIFPLEGCVTREIPPAPLPLTVLGILDTLEENHCTQNKSGLTH
jgi:hypothetical protein